MSGLQDIYNKENLKIIRDQIVSHSIIIPEYDNNYLVKNPKITLEMLNNYICLTGDYLTFKFYEQGGAKNIYELTLDAHMSLIYQLLVRRAYLIDKNYRLYGIIDTMEIDEFKAFVGWEYNLLTCLMTA